MLGLPRGDEDEEDNHLCIKCNATIIGLDNYVKHRKNMCGKSKRSLNISNDSLDQIKADASKSLSGIDPFQGDQQYNLGADVFFQSLELQSSVKKPTPTLAATTIPSSAKSSAGVLTRRATAAILATTVLTKPEPYKTSEASSDLVTNKRGEDWIGGHNLSVAGTDDNQTKLIKAVANICETAKKEHTPTSFSLIDDFKHDDDSNEDSDDSDDIEDDFHSQTGGKWKPPSTHTGGKWKPTYTSRESTSHWHSNTAITPEPDHGDDSDEEHTGGKWKSFMSQSTEALTRIDKLQEIDEDEEDAYMPPPGHTKGKWIPGAKDGGTKSDNKAQIMDATAIHKEGGSVQYWCGPCNRRLGSKNIYERHLASNLHMRRTLPEKELEYSGTIKTKKVEEDMDKRKSKPSLYLNDSIYTQSKRIAKPKKELIPFIAFKKKRVRRPTYVNCAVCKSKVKPYLMGKHLISHYHFRKGNPDDVVNKLQVLDNIERIVLQSPFQCSPCKFYFNWQIDFLEHCRSEGHKTLTENLSGVFWCSFCKFECAELCNMNAHLVGPDHQEVTAAINRSMPIVLRKKSIISCTHCKKIFRYNVQLKQHGRSHCRVVTSTATDEYQGKKHCSQCRFTCKSRIGLSRHILKRHGKKLYYCSACSLEFSSSKECLVHRNSQSHRIKEKEHRKEKGFDVKDLSKACPHCDIPKLNNVIELKRHIQAKHKDTHSSCPKCGMKFIFPQEVTWHIRNKACTFNNDSLPTYSAGRLWNCQICPFVSASHAECIFHEVLHGEAITEYDDIQGDKKEKSAVKYACPICHRLFLKPSLRCHLRQHTKERPYSCRACGASFSRKATLVSHTKNIHTLRVKPDEQQPVKKEEALAEAPKRFLCSACGAAFAKKYNLKQHATLHVGRAHSCPVGGCTYGARNASELRAHAATHSAARPHPCPHCTYAAKTRPQLSRHMKTHAGEKERKMQCPDCPYKAEQKSRMEKHRRLHTGNKPYACRFCSFTCNSLENLRKHVLYRNKHKDKLLYECEHCSSPDRYGSNFAKEFKVHLLTVHPDLYPNNKSTSIYVADYLKIENVDNEQFNSDYNIDGLKFDLINEDPMKFASALQVNDLDRDQQSLVVLQELPSIGCYSVTETGTLVPYLEKEPE